MDDAAVVGLGATAQGVVLSLALGGFKVVLVESSRGKMRRAVEDADNAASNLERQGVVDRRTEERARQHLVPSTAVAGVMDQVSFAAETAVDDLELKCTVLANSIATASPEPSTLQ